MLSRVLAVALFSVAVAAAPAQARTSPSFFGVNVDGPAVDDDGGLSAQAPAIRASGTPNIRVTASWTDLEPTEGQLRLAPFDELVLDAARNGLSVMPVVHRTPTWAASHPGVGGSPPADPSTYARFVSALVARYGPSGSLWAEHPEVSRVSIRRWQIWNEPEIATYWSEVDWAPGYTRLLKAAYAAIKRGDPGSEVVAAGMTNYSWIDLRKLYAAGGRRYFDIAAVHPYSREVAGVLSIVELARKTMRLAGDASKPLLLTEMSWSSGRGHSTRNYGWETTEVGQAARIRKAIPALAHRRTSARLAGLYWYTWMTGAIGGRNSFQYSGLRRVDGLGRPASKPALHAWRQTLARLAR